MITCKLQGGLGNQLFQIFATISHSLKTGQSFFFLNQKQLGNGENGSTIRYTYWKTFLSSLTPCLKNIEQIPQQTVIVKESGFHFQEILTTNFASTMLVGYFQSPKYFQKHYKFICRLIKLDIKKQIIKENLKSLINFDKTISVHFRLGDYKNLSQIHPILPYTYYKNALAQIVSEERDFIPEYMSKTVLYFCEDGDLETVNVTIEQLKTEYSNLNYKIDFIRAPSILEDWEQLIAMSLCRHNIIANSSFSWWGAYFNDSVSKIVCYPEQWFGLSVSHNTSDLFPDDWTVIA